MTFYYPRLGAWETNAFLEVRKMQTVKVARNVVSILACDSHFLNIANQRVVLGGNR